MIFFIACGTSQKNIEVKNNKIDLNGFSNTEKEELIYAINLLDEGLYKEAKFIFIQFYNNGHKSLSFVIGAIYHELEEFKNTVKWYEEAYSLGFYEVSMYLGDIYRRELIDFYPAIDWYKKAASYNLKGALSRIGSLYEDLNEVEKAKSYYIRADKNGDSRGTLSLARLYEFEGKSKEAIYWYKRAYEKGNYWAKKILIRRNLISDD